MMLYTKYESSESSSFRQEDFWKLYFENLFFDPPDLLKQPTGIVWTILVRDYPGIIHVKFGKNPMCGFREKIV